MECQRDERLENRKKLLQIDGGSKSKLVVLLQAVHVYWINVWFYMHSYESGVKKSYPNVMETESG